MPLPITLTLAAACALINVWLAIRCSRQRMVAKVLHGDGGDALLGQRMRAHANFIEYTPIVVILVGLVEMAAGASLWLWGMALAYTLARIAHGIGMDSAKPNAARAGGIIVTMLTTIGLAVTALVLAYGAGQTLPAPASLAAAA